jgi:amino acid transporter
MAARDEAVSGSAGSVLGLRRDAIGLREVLFQSITNMAPGAAIAAAIPAGALYAGGALPLSVLVALVACLPSASCIGLLARELPSAGSLATYTARGLHPAVGFLTAWGYVLVGVLIAPISLLQLGFTTASTINSDFRGYPATLWWPWSLAGAVIILAAGFYGIRTSARLGTILGTTEIAVFGVLAVFFIVHAGHANTAAVFTTKYTPKAFHGISGVIAGSVYSLLAFGGFEGAAPLAEEARDPRRTVPRAVLLATLGIGLLYVFTTYAVDVAFGPAAFAGFGSSGAASWVGMAHSVYGLFWVFVFLAIVNSTVASANAGFNVTSRTGYAMGRIGAFPHVAARVLPRHRSPVVAIFVTFLITVAVTLGLGLAFNPENAFAMVGTGIVIVIVAVYIVANAACIGYFASAANRGPRRRWNPLLHLIIPLAGIAAFVPAWLTAAGIRAFSFIAPLKPPSSYMGPGVAGFMFTGVIYLLYLYARHPQRVTEVGLVHIDVPELRAGAEMTA